MSRSRVAVQLLPRRWTCVFRSELLACLSCDEDMIHCVGKLVPKFLRVSPGGCRWIDYSPYRTARYVRFGQSVGNSMCGMLFQWNEMHQLLKREVDFNRFEFFSHRKYARALFLGEECSRTDAAKLFAVAFELWGEVCGVECSHRDFVTLAPARLSTGDPQCDDRGKKRCDCGSPGGPGLTCGIGPRPGRPAPDSNRCTESYTRDCYSFRKPNATCFHFLPNREIDEALCSPLSAVSLPLHSVPLPYAASVYIDHQHWVDYSYTSVPLRRSAVTRSIIDSGGVWKLTLEFRLQQGKSLAILAEQSLSSMMRTSRLGRSHRGCFREVQNCSCVLADAEGSRNSCRRAQFINWSGVKSAYGCIEGVVLRFSPESGEALCGERLQRSECRSALSKYYGNDSADTVLPFPKPLIITLSANFNLVTRDQRSSNDGRARSNCLYPAREFAAVRRKDISGRGPVKQRSQSNNQNKKEGARGTNPQNHVSSFLCHVEPLPIAMECYLAKVLT
ncbi:hypothetical protein LMG26858_02319 [Achromobacter anxifer]|uniref:Uncharacterized protein n=1 Tax=Achromobacter anxifer TaxID=1287737 RepID=A0A6S7CSA3_9BURK|nr:hypothetical protein LMG26858_02319 [Achromobacter anxifer]